MTIWQINTFVALADLAFLYLCECKASYLMKKRYPELHFLNKHWTVKLSGIIKAIVASFCPGFNIVLLYVLITKDDKLVEETIEDNYQAYIRQERERNKETHNGDNTVQTSEDSTAV